MSYKSLPENVLAPINPLDARADAAASGWKRGPTVNGMVTDYSHARSNLDQRLIPLDTSLVDYARRKAEVAVNLAVYRMFAPRIRTLDAEAEDPTSQALP